MREVIVISPNAKPLHDKIRTAAYCRVSSGSDEQLASFSSQVSEYTNRISRNPDWVMVDIYADEGISGTSAAKRPEFQRMMTDCRKKKIDRILTKSISRFARNVKECIAYIRELQSLGISIEFEKEGIDTAFLSGEMMVAVFGSLAQEESTSISSNMRLSYKGRMERGEFITCCAPFGYTLSGRDLLINSDEAEIVRKIFALYLSGFGVNEIAKELNHIKIYMRNGQKWYYQSISYILQNEKYCGDAILQKYFTERRQIAVHKRNDGSMPTFHVENSHPPIVQRAEFELVQQIMEFKRQRKKSDPIETCLQKRIECAECGSLYKKCIARNGRVSWVCYSHNRNRQYCPAKPVADIVATMVCVDFYRILKCNWKSIIQPLMLQLVALKDRSASNCNSLIEANKEITLIADQLHMLSRLRSRDLIDDESYLSQSNEMNRKLLALREQRQINIREQQEDDALDKTQEIVQILQDAPESLASLEDGGVFESIVDKVIIDKDKNITFRLINGLELGGFHG